MTLTKTDFESMAEKGEKADIHPITHKLYYFNQHLTLSQTTHFRPFQTERICRQKFQI